MGLFYFRACRPGSSGNFLLCFNPRRWGFFISGLGEQRLRLALTGVSIPVDGAFLFQGGSRRDPRASARVFQSP